MKKFSLDREDFALFLFHSRVGVRLALRVVFPLFAAIFALYYILGPEFVYSLMTAFVSNGLPASGIFSAVISLTIAGIAARRVCLGLEGWIRHLPAASQTHRRLAGVAIFIAQLPILIIMAVLASIASLKSGVPVAMYILGLPLLGSASALFVLPVEGKIIARPLAALACVFVSSGKWQFILGGIIMIAISDFFSRALYTKKRRTGFKSIFKGASLMAVISWRALRLRILFPFLLSLMVLGATILFLANNSLNPRAFTRAIFFGGALSMVVFCAWLADMLASRRPPWAWARSLPWASEKRIAADFCFIGLHTVPLLILVAIMNLKSALPLAVSLPLLVVQASGAMRQVAERRTGSYGLVLLNGTLGALSLSLIPLISLVFLALTPLAFKIAAEKEKNQKVSLWLELHHLAAGDPLSWSQR